MKLIAKSDRIFIAGHNGMVGRAIYKELKESGYGSNNQGKLLTVPRKQLNLLNEEQVKKWFNQNKPNVVIVAAAKVGGIYANNTYPTEFLLENLKIQNNLIQTSWQEGVKRLFHIGCKIEGKENADWVLLDFGAVIVHIFKPEVREYYQIEKMWKKDITEISK